MIKSPEVKFILRAALSVFTAAAILSPLHAGATFSRVKNWISGEVLTASDLNAEFDNLLSNLTPSGIDDYSGSSTDMRSTADPYPGFTESMATSLQGELERLRYQILQVKKAIQASSVTYWYEDLPSTGTFTIGANKVGVNVSTPAHALEVSGRGQFAHAAASATTFGTIGFADGTTFVGPAGGGQMEAETANYIVTPNVMKAHPTIPKAYVTFVGSGTVTILRAYNVSSVTDNNTGDYTLNFTTPFSDTNYGCVGIATWKSGAWSSAVMQDETNLGSTTVSAFRINVRDFATSTTVDAARVTVACYGDQ